VLAVRPCGACGQLVPADTGCDHWLPGLSGKAAEARAARRALNEKIAARRAAVAEFHRIMGVTS